MSFIVTESCVKCLFGDCIEVCPVDCFYQGKDMLVINPNECIDCALCEPECPVKAISSTNEISKKKYLFVKINKKMSNIWRILKKNVK